VSRREIFLEAADVALPLVEHELVAKRWTEPSALPRMSVGGLATHLAGQVVSAHAALAAPSAASRETRCRCSSTTSARSGWRRASTTSPT